MHPNSLIAVSTKTEIRRMTHKSGIIRDCTESCAMNLVRLFNALSCRLLGLATEETNSAVGPMNDGGMNLKATNNSVRN